MRQTKTLPPVPVPFADGSLQVVANPCWEMALPDVISEFLVQVLGPIPRDVLLVHSPVSSQETPASHLVERVSHIACSRQCSFSRGANFEAAVIRLCSGPCTRSASRLHPPQDRTSISGGQALYTTQNSVGYLPRAVASLRTRFRAIGTAGLSPAGYSALSAAPPPSGSSVDAARDHGPQILTEIRGRGSGKSRRRSWNRSHVRRLRWLRRQSHLYQMRFT